MRSSIGHARETALHATPRHAKPRHAFKSRFADTSSAQRDTALDAGERWITYTSDDGNEYSVAARPTVHDAAALYAQRQSEEAARPSGLQLDGFLAHQAPQAGAAAGGSHLGSRRASVGNSVRGSPAAVRSAKYTLDADEVRRRMLSAGYDGLGGSHLSATPSASRRSSLDLADSSGQARGVRQSPGFPVQHASQPGAARACRSGERGGSRRASLEHEGTRSRAYAHACACTDMRACVRMESLFQAEGISARHVAHNMHQVHDMHDTHVGAHAWHTCLHGVRASRHAHAHTHVCTNAYMHIYAHVSTQRDQRARSRAADRPSSEASRYITHHNLARGS